MTAIQRGQKDIMCFIDELTPQEVFSTIDSLVYDHPELFYLDNIGVRSETNEENIYYMRIDIDKEIAQIGSEKAIEQVAAQSKKVIEKANKLKSEEEKVRFLFETLVESVEYTEDDIACVCDQNLYSAIVLKETYEPEIPTEEETTRKNEFEVVLDEFLLNGSDLLEKVPHRIAGKADTLYVDVKIFTEECHPYDANCRMFTYEYDETLKEIYLFSYATEVLMVKLTLESKRFEQLYDSYHYLFAQGTMQCDAPFVEDGVMWIPFLLIADMYDMEINVVYQGDSLLKEDIADYDKDSYVMGE